MKPTFPDRLLRRELGDLSRYSAIKGLYGVSKWIDDLDIVDELGGHSGCINALSWSSSGRLLASGSDDQHLNIHTYQPECSVSQFALTTTVTTGHTANIFSVKFMPHSNDTTLVTCAGDSEVRVFDIEHSSGSTVPSTRANPASKGRGANLDDIYNGVRYLSDGDTNARIYRSHADRVKRIVTESSPYLFLTCSEDGEVRQFDLRLPSSAYPAPSGGRGLFSHRGIHADPNVPPPLISYKRYHLDLNTISCSASQPHYIALGGAHLHCFLHDRRMLGRDVMEERGDPGSHSPAGRMPLRENTLMGQATQCVRKFAPGGRKRMRRIEHGHITACKISDANPNEMIVSWSVDHIYSFDLVKSPDATENVQEDVDSHMKGRSKGKMKESGDRNRKRNNQNLSNSVDAARPSSKSRQMNGPANDDADQSLRAEYKNGASEDIVMENRAVTVQARDESQKRSFQITKKVVEIRRLTFSFDVQTRESVDSADIEQKNLTAQFTSILGYAATCLPEMDAMISSWRYPMDPHIEDVYFQQSLRSDREASRRFVQAAGTLARLLGGRLQTASLGSSPALQLFQRIAPTPKEGPYNTRTQIFCYEFLKAITLWLNDGRQALLEGFKRPANHRANDPRYPVPDDAELSGIDDYIIPYMLGLSQENFIPNVDASRFETDGNRRIFQTETSAVIAFSHAIRLTLEDIAQTSPSPGQTPLLSILDRKTAMKFWGFKVGRGLLLNAAKEIDFGRVDRAFGGLGVGHTEERIQDDIDLDDEGGVVQPVSMMEQSTTKPIGGSIIASSKDPLRETQINEDRTQDDIDPHKMEDVVRSVSMVKQSTNESVGRSMINSSEDSFPNPENNGDTSAIVSSSPTSMSREPTVDDEGIGSDADVVLMEDIHNSIARHLDEGYDEDDGSSDDEEDDGEGDEDDYDPDGFTAEERQSLFQSAADRGKLRESVLKDVECTSHTRQYSGHCNVKTVKDVNFFGLQDEYVVSGSDSGHVFIWDKKTSALVNILKGDTDVVNVVQGHPYEPLLAVSGIDSTIKIFSPDGRAQADARAGTNIGSAFNHLTGFSSASQRRRTRNNADLQSGSHEGLPSGKCMDNCYQIISENDLSKQEGARDAFITRGMLAQFAARLQSRQELNGDWNEEGIPGVVEGNCQVM